MKFLRVASLCIALFAPIAHASESYEVKASVAFAADVDNYLLVYSSNETEGGPHIYARRLNSDGAPLGRDFRLSTQTGVMSKPVLAYNPVTKRFLVLWSRKLYGADRAEIVGLNVSNDGTIVGTEFRVSFSDVFDQRPAIAYCPGRNRFLATWTNTVEYNFEDGTADINGQFVGGDGSTLQGSNFSIASAEKNQFKSDVTCDVVNDRFLVVWEDQRNLATKDDIYGQLMSSDGTMIGANYFIAGTPDIERRPVLAANSKDGTYLMAWESEEAATHLVFSQRLDRNGNPLGRPARIGSALEGSLNRPAVAYLPQQDVFFVVFCSADAADEGVYGQFVNSTGKLRDIVIPMTTANMAQHRPDVAAADNTFLAVWTDYRPTANMGNQRDVYEYYGRVIGKDMALSSRWKNPNSQ